MKITFTIDSELREKLDGVTGNPLFWDTYRLIKEASKRGHEVRAVQSEDAVVGNGFSQEFYLDKGIEASNGFTTPDVLFIRGYGMRVDKNCFNNLVDTVKSIESKIPLVINSGETTAFSRKDKQKTLPLPFIPSHRINNVSDIKNLLNKHKEGLILKPDYGLQSIGVGYVGSEKDLENLLEQGVISEQTLLNDYSAEKFIVDKREIRYIHLFGDMIGSRIADKTGEPGKEELGTRYLNTNPNEKHLEIVRRAIDLTGSKFGCVDFRGDNILEINGSGTQTFYRTGVGGGKEFLDFTSDILDSVERKYGEL